MKAYNDLEKDEKKSAVKPVQVRLCLEDTTIEAAQEVLVGSPNGVLLFQDELSGFFGSMDKYSGARGAAKDRGFWLQSWNGGAYAVNRIGRGADVIPNLSVNLMGGVQPDVIKKLASESYDNGFLQRMILVMLRPAVMGKDEATPCADEYAALVDQLLDLKPPTVFGGTPVPLSFTPEAQAIRNELERKHLSFMQIETVNKKLASHIGKYNGYVGRLSLLWHCIEHADEKTLPVEITEDTVQRVADFMHQFLLPHAVAFYAGALGLADDHDHLALMAGFILAHKMDNVTNRDIAQNGTLRKLTRRETDATLEQLDAFGWVTPVPGPRTTHWAVNPLVHVRFAERRAEEVERRAAAKDALAAVAGRGP